MADSTKIHTLEMVKQEDDSDLEATEEQDIALAASTHAAPENRGASTLGSPHHERVQRVIQQPPNLGPIIPFDENQALVTSYPPGCPVLHVNASATPPIVTIGQTHSVAFNMAMKELQFCIIPAHGGDAIVAFESQLQYAPLCRVEATVNDDTGPTKRQASVLTSYQPSPTSAALYSIQEDGACGSIFHGIPKESIKYRPNVASSIVSPVVTTSMPVAATSVPAEATNTSGTSSPPGLTKTAQSQARVVMNSSHPEHSDHSAAIHQSAHEIDDAMSTSSGGNSPPAKQSIVKARKVSPDVATKRRKSNEGVSIAIPSPREEAMNRELYTPRKSRASDRQTSPEQSRRKQSPTTKRERNDDFSLVDTTSMASRAREGDQPVECTKFIIPHSSFGVAAMADLFGENGATSTISRTTNCRIRFKAERHSSSRRNDLWNMHLEVNGTPCDTRRAITAIERILVRTLCYEEQGRALYYMALLNGHRCKNPQNKVVRQFCCHFHKEGMKYMISNRLPPNYKDVIGICIGKNGSRKKRIENKTKCKIEFNTKDSQHPHYVVYGDNEENVMECTRQIGAVLQEATDIKQAECSQQNSY